MFTDCARVVDSGNHIHLKCVDWYGAHQELFVVGGKELQTIANISRQIARMAASSARIPFSFQMVLENPKVLASSIGSIATVECPNLSSIRALHIMDCVVDRLAADGLMVIMNNNVSCADWVGAVAVSEQGLCILGNYSTSDWIASLRVIAARYSANPLVVGMNQRNEIHDRVPPPPPPPPPPPFCSRHDP